MRLSNYFFNKDRQKLKFFVCGMPRGGTSLTGELLNGHKDIYCYFGETGILPLLEMIAGDNKIPKDNVEKIKDWIINSLTDNLISKIDDIGFQKDISSYKRVLTEVGYKETLGYEKFSMKEVESICNNILDLLYQGYYGSDLIQAGIEIVNKCLCSKTDREIIGEKNPDNLRFLKYFSSNNIKVISLLREPLSTIDSMRKRSTRSEEVWDKAFSPSFNNSLAQYYRYLKYIFSSLSSLHSGKLCIIKYEDLLSYKLERTSNLYEFLGVSPCKKGLEFVDKLVHENNKSAIMHYSDEEILILKLLIGKELSYLGYDNSFYENYNLKLNKIELNFENNIVFPLEGVYLEGKELLQDSWMDKTATFYSLIKKQCKKIIFTLLFNFIDMLTSGNIVTLSIYQDTFLIDKINLNGLHNEHEIEINIDNIIKWDFNYQFYFFTFKLISSFSVKPIAVKGLGLDIRELSFFIKSVKFI